MLVLSRGNGERIIIGDGAVIITVVDIRYDRVRIGIEADPDIPIHRAEVQEAIERKRLQAQRTKQRESQAD